MSFLILFSSEDNLFACKRVLYSFSLKMRTNKLNISRCKTFRLALCLLAMSLFNSISASHLIGGEVYYTHTSGNN